MSKLRVSLHGVSVGVLERRADGLVTFRFDAGYLEMVDRPVLSRWYEDHLSPEFVEKSSQAMAPPFFQNYLPDPGSALRSLLARRAGVSVNHELSLLAALGADLPGAVAVGGLRSDDQDDITESVRTEDPRPDGPLRFSLAGMQLKFSVSRRADKLTLPVTGVGGRFILKMPSRELPRLPHNELATMTWARAAGITVPDVSVVRLRDVEGLPAEVAFAEEEALLVARFDRPADGGPRIHQEDFAQVLGKRPTEKYGRDGGVTFDRIGKIIARVCGEADFIEFVHRLVFMVICANPDAHLKNWSLIYPDGRRPRLSPAYDLVSTADYPGISAELSCRLGGEWQMGRIRAWHFGVLASHAGFDAQRGVEWASEAAQRARDAWVDVRAELPFTTSQRLAVERHLASVHLP